MGINIYVVDKIDASALATLKANGIYAISGQDSVGLANINDPTIVGWWMSPDEPDNAQSNGRGGYGPPLDPSVLVSEYNSYKAQDPTRPLFLGLGQGVAYDSWEGRGGNPPPESGYVLASDIISFDVYPYNACGGDANAQVICGQFWLSAFGVDRLHQWSNRNQAVWTWIETTDINGFHGPSPEQTASEVWLSLIHGANGIGYFVHVFSPSFRADGIFNNSAMVSAVTAVNRQIKSLAAELNSGNAKGLVSVTSANSSVPIDTMVKVNGTAIYVFAAVSRAGTTTGDFVINGMTGNGIADVTGENRTITVTSGHFFDPFAANGVHIYKIDLADVTCN
jgi:hypothetical protein